MNAFEQRLTERRRDFHRNPELGFQETRTKREIARELRALGLEVHEGAGVVGVLRSGQGNRAIALRADMDALPIPEMSTHDYPSDTPGVMNLARIESYLQTVVLGGLLILAVIADQIRLRYVASLKD